MICDKYLFQTKIQYNENNKRQNILRERNIIFLRQTHGSLKLKLIGQKSVLKHAEQTRNTTAIRRIAVRETSSLRNNGYPNYDPPEGGPSLHYGIEGSKGAPYGPQTAKIRQSLRQRMRVLFNVKVLLISGSSDD